MVILVRIEEGNKWVGSCDDLRGNGSKFSIRWLKIDDFVLVIMMVVLQWLTMVI
jgi:hypothetical protein